MIAALFARPLVKFGLPALAIVLGIIAWSIWLSDVKHDARKEGVADERAARLEDTLNQMEKANDARREIRDDRSRARYDECVRSARNPENCLRLLPQ